MPLSESARATLRGLREEGVELTPEMIEVVLRQDAPSSNGVAPEPTGAPVESAPAEGIPIRYERHREWKQKIADEAVPEGYVRLRDVGRIWPGIKPSKLYHRLRKLKNRVDGILASDIRTGSKNICFPRRAVESLIDAFELPSGEVQYSLLNVGRHGEVLPRGQGFTRDSVCRFCGYEASLSRIRYHEGTCAAKHAKNRTDALERANQFLSWYPDWAREKGSDYLLAVSSGYVGGIASLFVPGNKSTKIYEWANEPEEGAAS